MEPPIEPGEFADFDALQSEIARRHEPAVLAWPEGLQEPLFRWRPADAADAEFSPSQ
jgi:hypothetical protein